MKKSDLYSSLWAGCDELRGGLDAFRGVARGSVGRSEDRLRLVAANRIWTANDSCCRNLPFTIDQAV